MGISIVDRKKILDDVTTKLQRTRDTGIIMDDMSYVKFKDDIIEFIESVYENIEFAEIFADTSLYLDTTKPKIPFLPKFKITYTPKNEFMESAPKCGYLPNNVAMMGIDLSESTKIENYISFVNYKSTIRSMCDILSSVLRNYNTL